MALQAAGGLALGLIAALAAIWAMRSVDDYVVEVSLSLALAMAAYAGAQALHLSGPIAAVGAGLLSATAARGRDVTPPMREHLTSFWTLVDELLNAVLFFLLGLLLLVMPLQARLGGLAIAGDRAGAGRPRLVVLPWGAYFHLRHEERGARTILVWGGLHGALSVGLGAHPAQRSPNAR